MEEVLCFVEETHKDTWKIYKMDDQSFIRQWHTPSTSGMCIDMHDRLGPHKLDHDQLEIRLQLYQQTIHHDTTQDKETNTN